MRDTVAAERTPITPEHLLQLLIARNWLAIGINEEARREFDSLPPHAKMLPEADAIRHQLFISERYQPTGRSA